MPERGEKIYHKLNISMVYGRDYEQSWVKSVGAFSYILLGQTYERERDTVFFFFCFFFLFVLARSSSFIFIDVKHELPPSFSHIGMPV